MSGQPLQMRSRAAGFAAAGTLAFLYLPILVLTVLSFNANDLTTVWSGFSLKWYGVALADDGMLRALGNSLVVAAAATLLATAAALAAALGVGRLRHGLRAPVEGLLGLPLLVPEIITGVALLMMFVLGGMTLGLATVALAHTVFCIPFAYYPIRSRLDGLDPALLEAARDLYAPAWQRFLRVEVPLLGPGIFAGALLAFISSLGDFVVTYFVAGPGATTLPVYIYGMIRIGITPEVNALSALVLLASIALIAVVFLLKGTTTHSNKEGVSR